VLLVGDLTTNSKDKIRPAIETKGPSRELNFKIKKQLLEKFPKRKEIYQLTYETYTKSQSKDSIYVKLFLYFVLTIMLLNPISWIVYSYWYISYRRNKQMIETFYTFNNLLIYEKISFQKVITKEWEIDKINKIMFGKNISILKELSEYNIREEEIILQPYSQLSTSYIYADMAEAFRSAGFEVIMVNVQESGNLGVRNNRF